jgi:hypothetical protein
MDMKWDLKVWIALSAWLRLCCPGGTSSYVMPLPGMHAFIAAEHSLSSTCFLIPNPAAFIRLIIFWYTLIISPSVLFFIGSAKM